MAYREISDKNYGIGHDIVTGNDNPDYYQALSQATELAATGITKGYSSLGLYATGAIVQRETYHMAGSPWSKALSTSVARIVQTTLDQGKNISEIDPIATSHQIAADTIVQVEAWQAAKSIDYGFETSFDGRLQEQYIHAKHNPAKLADLKEIARGTYHLASSEAQEEVRSTIEDKADTSYPRVTYELTRAATIMKDARQPQGIGDNVMYDECATAIIQKSRGEEVTDFAVLMDWYGYTETGSQNLIEAAKIVSDIALATSPSQKLIESTELGLPPMERKIERAVQYHMDHFKNTDSLEQTTFAILAATEAQIAAQLAVNTADLMQDYKQGFQVTRLSNLQNEAPELFKIALRLNDKENNKEYADMNAAAFLKIEHMEPSRASELSQKIGNTNNLSFEQRDAVYDKIASQTPQDTNLKTQNLGAIMANALNRGR